MKACLVTAAAKSDFSAVLKETKDLFGTRQRAIYKRLISTSVKMVADDPTRGGSWDRGGVVPGLWAFHLEHAAGKSGAASHALCYAVEHLADGSRRVVILRLLNEAMEPKLHIARASINLPSTTPKPPENEGGSGMRVGPGRAGRMAAKPHIPGRAADQF